MMFVATQNCLWLNIFASVFKIKKWKITNIEKLKLAKNKQESPAIADKPARRESLPNIAPIRRAYNYVADNTGLSSFV